MKTVFILSFFLLFIGVKAQDVHFSQYAQVPFYHHPAQTGLMSNAYRFSANSKIQWNSVTSPFETYLAAFDIGFQRKGSFLGKFGIGVDFMREKAGDAGFGTSGAGFSFSYIKAIGRANNRFVAAGASFRMHQRSFDQDALNWDNQFNGLYFDPSLPGGEIFVDDHFWFPALGGGVAFYNKQSSASEWSGALSVMNINRPHQSHFGNADVRLPMRWTSQIRFKSTYARNHEWIGSIFFSTQGAFREWLPGVEYRVVKSYNPWDYTAFSGGLFYRIGDGAIVSAKMDYLNYRFGISYDVNVSDLSPASDLRGGFEFSMSVVFDPPKQKTKREIPCPIF